MSVSCFHDGEFFVDANVNRLVDSRSNLPDYLLEITVRCGICGRSFVFNGLSNGIRFKGAAMSLDGKEARLSIEPRPYKKGFDYEEREEIDWVYDRYQSKRKGIEK